MSVNTEIYGTGNRYTIKSEPAPTRPQRENMIATSTRSLRDLIQNNPGWNSGAMDSSNVYTTFNPDKFPGLFGATVTDFNPVITDPSNDEDWNNTGTSTSTYHPPRAKELSWNEANTTRVNLRYVICNVSSAGSQPHYMFRWTNVDDMVKSSLLGSADNSVVYQPYKPSTDNWVARYNNETQLNGTNQFQFVNDINRDNIMIAFAPNFMKVTDNSGYGLDSVALQSTGTAPLGKPEMWDWLQNNDDGWIENTDRGEKYVCVGMDIYLFQKSVSADGTVTYFNGQYTGKRYDNVGTEIENFPTANSCCYALSLLCERVVNGNYYYYTIPFSPNSTGSAKGGCFYVNTADWANMDNYPALFPIQPQMRDRGNKYSINPYNGFNGGMTLSDEPDDPNFLRGFTVFPQGSGSMTFDYNTPSSDTNINPNDTDHARQWNQIKGKDIFSFGWSSGGSGIAYGYYGASHHIYSGKELMAMIACFMIPAVYNYSNSSLTRFNKADDEQYSFIGVRNADGSVSGDYIPYVWGETEVEQEMIPDDFVPFDPSTDPDEPDVPSPPDADRTKGDSGSILPAGAYEIGGATGMCTYYVMGYAETRAFGKSLWGGVDPAQLMKNFYYFNDNKTDYQMSYSEILDYVTGLKYFPFVVSQYANTVDSGERGYRLGNGTTLLASPSWAFGNTTYLGSVLCELDGGSVYIPHEENNFMDYEPCSVASIYVPFCGTADIKLSSVTGKTLYLKYYVDLVSGCCLAIVSMRGEDGEFPIAQLNGVVGFDMLLTGNNQNQQMSSIVSSLRHTAMSVGGSIVSAGLGAVSGDVGAVAGGLVGAGESVANTAIQMPQTASLHPMTAGSNSSLSSLCGYITAFVQATRVLSQTPKNYGNTVGYIVNSQHSISSLHGFTQAVNPDLNGVPATEQEKQMIQSILETGFYA